MTDVFYGHAYGYLTDIRSSGSDIRWISDAQGFRQGSRVDGTDAPKPRRGPTLNAVKYEGTYLSS